MERTLYSENAPIRKLEGPLERLLHDPRYDECESKKISYSEQRIEGLPQSRFYVVPRECSALVRFVEHPNEESIEVEEVTMPMCRPQAGRRAFIDSNQIAY